MVATGLNFFVFKPRCSYLYNMKKKIKEKLNILAENNTISQDDINNKLRELTEARKQLVRERASINKKIKKLDEQLEYWKNMLPNQTSLF
jgi:uncharacterized coiled-coil DUF342 family protein